MTHNVKSYIPETLYAKEKQAAPTEPCAEDFAVIDLADGYRVVACRAAGLSKGAVLPEAWGIEPVELDFLECAVPAKRAVIASGHGALLCFGEFIESTGLLLVARPHLSASALLGALRLLRRTDCHPSPALVAEVETVERAPEESACEAVERLLYYLDRMLISERYPAVGLWQRCLLAAHFAGCRLENIHPSANTPRLFRGDSDRLMLFLLCTMLELRQTSRLAHAELQELPSFSFSMSIGRKEREERDDVRPEFPFLDLLTFRDISLTESEEGICLEMLLRQKEDKNELHAFGSARRRLRIFLAPIAG